MVTLRTIEQAHALDKTLAELGIELEGVINIEVNPDSLLERLSGRIIHRVTGETFHKVFNPPVDYKEEDYYQREDDKPETVKTSFGCEYCSRRTNHCSLPCQRFGS